MSSSPRGTGKRGPLVWGLGSLAAAALLGVVLSLGISAVERWRVLPPPQAPAWYDCESAGQGFALQYRQGSDRLVLRWPSGETAQADSWPDRIVWRDMAAMEPARRAALPVLFRYESAQRLELRSAADRPIACTLQATAHRS